MEEKSKAVVVAFATLLGGLSVELFGTIRFAEILGDEKGDRRQDEAGDGEIF